MSNVDGARKIVGAIPSIVAASAAEVITPFDDSFGIERICSAAKPSTPCTVNIVARPASVSLVNALPESTIDIMAPTG